MFDLSLKCIYLVLFFLAVSGIHFFLYRKCKHWKENSLISTIFIDMALKPLPLFIWMLFLDYLNSQIGDQNLYPYLNVISSSGIVFSFLWALKLLLRKGSFLFLKYDPHDALIIEMVSRVLLFAVFWMGAVIVFPLFGVDIKGVLAVGGIGGIILGVASRDIFANIASGILLAFDAPFHVGDFIFTDQCSGIVQKIGWRFTTLEAEDHKVVYIPNSLFSSMIFRNASLKKERNLIERWPLEPKHFHRAKLIVDSVRSAIEKELSPIERQNLTVTIDKMQGNTFSLLVKVIIAETSEANYQLFHERILIRVGTVLEELGCFS